MSEQIPIVDENDNILYYKERADVKREEIYRVSALWIENSKGEVLLAQRALTKSHDPGKWGPAVAGTVAKGETYEANIIKEAREELGISGQTFTIAFKKRSTGIHNYFAQYFFVKLDFTLDMFNTEKKDVKNIQWIAKEKLKLELKTNPDIFLKSLPDALKLFEKN
jgi:isopentenyl-diphosphate Delta-isomerase